MIASIGIDLGACTTKIAAAKRGGIQVLTNQASFRETPSIVGYGSAERKVGQTGLNKLKTNFLDSVISPQRFFGLSPNSPALKIESKFNFSKIGEKNNQLVFQIGYDGKSYSLLPEQIVASYLSQLKEIIKNNNLLANQIVLSVPSYFTQAQRQSLLQASQIADLKVSKLLNECTAIANEYGISRKSQFDQKIPRNVLFIDFGYSKLSTYLCSFKKQEAQFLYSKHDRNLGIRNIDANLMEFYGQLFYKKTSLNLFANKKAIIKLRDSVQKQRKILSGNKEHELNLQYLMEDQDLLYNMKRQQMQNISKSVFNQISKVLHEAKKFILNKKIPIHSIQLLGGGTRIPCFIQLIEKIFKIQPSRTLNASQAIAKGCALVAAAKSPIFKVPQYKIIETVPEKIIVSWNIFDGKQGLGYDSVSYNNHQRYVLYNIGDQLQQKELRIPHKENIEILVQYEDTLPGKKNLLSYCVTIPKSKNKMPLNTIIKFGFDQNGFLKVTGCQNEDQPQVRQNNRQRRNNFSGFGNNFFGGMRNTFAGFDHFGGDFDQDYRQNTPRNEPLKRYPLNYQQYFPYKRSADQISKMQMLEKQMKIQDNIILETYELKNNVESLIYQARQKIEENGHIVSKEKLNQWTQTIEMENNWLFSEGQHAQRLQYQEKKLKIQGILKQITDKINSFNNVQDKLKNLNDKICKKEQEKNNEQQKLRLQSMKGWINGQLQLISKRQEINIQGILKIINDFEGQLQKMMSVEINVEKNQQPEIIEEERTNQ